MLEPYIDRLAIIRDMLKSPQRESVQEAYDLLFQLWMEYADNPDFSDNVEIIASEYPKLAQEFTDRLNKLSDAEERKTLLLKKIILLYPSKNQQEIQTYKQADKELPKSTIPKMFISYSHKDESFKDELVIMLAGLQRRGVIDAWQDRRIEPGEGWFNAIEKAMNECDIAVLLVSPDFIASEFIQREELTHLFQRRIEEGLRVVPVIVRPCLWKSEPVIKDLAALPKDGEPVIGFSKETGKRDHVWLEISEAIENIALQTAAVTIPPDNVPEEETPSQRDRISLVKEKIDESQISILFLAADPSDAARLRLGEELREIQEKLQLSKFRDKFDLNQRMSVRPEDISQALLDTQPRIVHFSGHGTSAGELCFENNMGRKQPIEPGALASLFKQFSEDVSCVILNACYSEKQAEAISKHIRFVIGMNKAIGDRAAIAFAVGFYQGLGAGRTFEEAYELGCVQIGLQGIPENLTPILIKRE